MKNIMLSYLIIISFLFSISGIAVPLSQEAIHNKINALFERGGHTDSPERRERLLQWIGTEEANELRLEFLEREWANTNFSLFSSAEEAQPLCEQNKEIIVFYLSTTEYKNYKSPFCKIGVYPSPTFGVKTAIG